MPSATPPFFTKTFHHPSYTYLHLRLTSFPHNPSTVNKSQRPPIDEITALSHLKSALNQSLGLTGTAIPIDILKVEDQDVWVRIPYDDGNAVRAAVSTWSDSAKGVSLRVMGSGAWLGALVGRRGGDGKLWRLD